MLRLVLVYERKFLIGSIYTVYIETETNKQKNTQPNGKMFVSQNLSNGLCDSNEIDIRRDTIFTAQKRHCFRI